MAPLIEQLLDFQRLKIDLNRMIGTKDSLLATKTKTAASKEK
jgi:hypothetical protein